LCYQLSPKFAKRYANLWQVAGDAVRAYVREVGNGTFPSEDHSFHSLVSVQREEKAAAEG